MKPSLPLLALLLAACGGETATLSFELVFPAGTDRLPVEATTARLTLDTPPKVVEGPIAADGSFSLALEVPADGTSSTVTFEALDATGTVLVRGQSPPVPLALFQDTLRLFVAPPGRFSEAHVSLDPARESVAVAPLSYGFVVAGGLTRPPAGAQPEDDMAIYSVYLHELTPGENLPEARWGAVAATGDFGIVYLAGGVGPEGPTGDVFRLDTNAAPDGDYTMLNATLETAGGQAAGVGGDRFVITVPEDVSRILDGTAGTVTALPSATLSAETATTTIDAEGHVVVVLIGPDGGALVDATAGETTPLDLTPGTEEIRRGHTAVRLPDGDVLAIGGAYDIVNVYDTAIRVTPEGVISVVPLLSTARQAAAAAITGNLLVVAGGLDDFPTTLSDAEIFDATTLAPLGTVPLAVPRAGATALTLPNGLIVLLGGSNWNTFEPIGTIEFFTP